MITNFLNSISTFHRQERLLIEKSEGCLKIINYCRKLARSSKRIRRAVPWMTRYSQSSAILSLASCYSFAYTYVMCERMCTGDGNASIVVPSTIDTLRVSIVIDTLRLIILYCLMLSYTACYSHQCNVKLTLDCTVVGLGRCPFLNVPPF